MNEFFHENATLAIEVDFGEGIRKFCKYTHEVSMSVIEMIHVLVCVHAIDQAEGANTFIHLMLLG